ncbi:MAG TPA: VTT domain-containing protein [Solirubrobacterales bacterium]|nr:VTT domain-containing protein [Solirubrobacterales bacterium]
MHGDDGSAPISVAGRPPLTGVALTLAGIALLAAVVVAVEPLRTGIGDAVSGDTESLREDLRALGAPGVLAVLGLALAHSVVWYPAEILDAAAGFVYGFWLGLPLVMAGWLVNAIVAYWIGRHAARPLLYRLFGRERFLRYEGAVRRGGVTLLLAMRLVPVVPFSLFSYVAGAAHVPVTTFMWTTGLGYLPLTAVFVYVGSTLDDLSPTDPILWLGAILLVVLLLLGRRVARILARAGPAESRGGGPKSGAG